MWNGGLLFPWTIRVMKVRDVGWRRLFSAKVSRRKSVAQKPSLAYFKPPPPSVHSKLQHDRPRFSQHLRGTGKARSDKSPPATFHSVFKSALAQEETQGISNRKEIIPGSRRRKIEEEIPKVLSQTYEEHVQTLDAIERRDMEFAQSESLNNCRRAKLARLRLDSMTLLSSVTYSRDLFQSMQSLKRPFLLQPESSAALELLKVLISKSETTLSPVERRVLLAALGYFPFSQVFEAFVRSKSMGDIDSLMEIISSWVIGKNEPVDFYSTLSSMLLYGSRADINASIDPKTAREIVYKLFTVFKLSGQKSASVIHQFHVLMRMELRFFDKYRFPVTPVLELFHDMCSRNYPPNVISWSMALGACGRLGDLTLSYDLLDVMVTNGVSPSITLANSLVDGLSKSEETDALMQIFNKMRNGVAWKSGRSLSPFSWSTPVMHLGEGLDDISPSNVIQVNAGDNKIRKVTQGRVSMSAGTIENSKIWPKPTTFTYNKVLTHLARKKMLEEAFQLYMEMKNTGIYPDDVTINVITSLFKDSQYGCEIFKIEQPRLMPSRNHFNVSKNLLKEGIFDSEVGSNHLDLHNLTRTQAMFSLVAHLEALGEAVLELANIIETEKLGGKEDLEFILKKENQHSTFVVITGKGLNTEGTPILRDMVEQVLKARNIEYYTPEWNSGRVILPLFNLYKLGHQKREEIEQLKKQEKKSKLWGASMIVGSSVSLFCAGQLPWSEII